MENNTKFDIEQFIYECNQTYVRNIGSAFTYMMCEVE